MKIVLSKDDVMEMICKKYGIDTIYSGFESGLLPKYAKVYWEGNPDEEMIGREAAKEPKKK